MSGPDRSVVGRRLPVSLAKRSGSFGDPRSTRSPKRLLASGLRVRAVIEAQDIHEFADLVVGLGKNRRKSGRPSTASLLASGHRGARCAAATERGENVSKRRATPKRALFGVVAVAAFALAASVAWATGTLDQQNPGPSSGFFGICGPPRLAQTFTAGLTGSLDTVDLGLSLEGPASGDEAVVSILGTSSGVPQDGQVLATQAVPHISATNTTTTVVFASPASITAGTQYALVFGAPTCVPDGDHFYQWNFTADTYSGGQACSKVTTWSCPSTNTEDFIFATYVTPPPPSADVAVSIAGPTSAKKGAQVTYVITVSNAGPDTAHNVVLKDPVPAGATFLAISTTAGSCTGPRVGKQGPITCALGDLASGSNAVSSASIKVTAKIGSTIANVATAHSTDDGAGLATADPQESNNTASLITQVTK